MLNATILYLIAFKFHHWTQFAFQLIVLILFVYACKITWKDLAR